MTATRGIAIVPDETNSEEWLVRRAVTGDRDALAELVTRHEPAVRRLTFRLLGWRADADDVVQDVFAAMLASLRSFRGESRFATWLHRITVNECRRHARRERLWFWLKRAYAPVRAELERDIAAQDSARQDSAGSDASASGAATPLPAASHTPGGAASIEAHERTERLRAAVHRLAQKDREVIVLHHLEELPVAEIAAILDTTPNAVDVRLTRARQRLRELLGGELEATP
jgi:RNA polymerase sigma-70 factor (ECF subfamily)